MVPMRIWKCGNDRRHRHSQRSSADKRSCVGGWRFRLCTRTYNRSAIGDARSHTCLTAARCPVMPAGIRKNPQLSASKNPDCRGSLLRPVRGSVQWADADPWVVEPGSVRALLNNWLLKRRLRGKRVRFAEAERVLLARKAKAVGRKGLLELDTDKRSRTYVVTRFGSEGKAAAGPALTKKPSRRRRSSGKRRGTKSAAPAQPASETAEGMAQAEPKSRAALEPPEPSPKLPS